METQTASSKSSRSAPARSNANTKAAQALAIFNRLHGKKPRKDVVHEIATKVGLAPSSANTYYQRFLHEDDTKRPKRPSGSSGRGRMPDESSKAGVARAIFRKLGGKRPRKDVIAAFIDQAGLTPAGASTYYQKLKSAA